ncbi:MAG: YgiT-type zinc finger protein [Ignavibacteria bacterium]|nr:YgiT-type zinc finger protein [Ignavibacteria bacterium]
MRCYNCGENLEKIFSDMPFKVSNESVVIIKRLPVLQCPNCQEYLLEDIVMKKVEEKLSKVSVTAELEILKYVA